MHIRDVPEELIKKLDSIYIEEGYSSRSQLIVDVLTKYAALKDRIYAEAISSVTRAIIRDEIENLDSISKASLRLIEQASLKFLEASQKIDTYFFDDFFGEKSDVFSSDRKNEKRNSL